jgi:hypothetical protein
MGPFDRFERVYEAWQKRGRPCKKAWIRAWVRTYVTLETFARNMEKKGLSGKSARDRAKIARSYAERCYRV